MDTKNAKTNNQIFLVNDDLFRTTILYKFLTDLGYRKITCFSKGADWVNRLQNDFDDNVTDFFKTTVDFPEFVKTMGNAQEAKNLLKNIIQSS